MRELNINELDLVAGGNTHQCTAENSYGGITNTSNVGVELINFYEGLVSATSYVIERVVRSF